MPAPDESPSRQIADIEERIRDLSDRLEQCRTIAVAGKAIVACGLLVLVLLALEWVRLGPAGWLFGAAAPLAGIVLFGSNWSTEKELTSRIGTLEAQRTELIDGLHLHPVRPLQLDNPARQHRNRRLDA